MTADELTSPRLVRRTDSLKRIDSLKRLSDLFPAPSLALGASTADDELASEVRDEKRIVWQSEPNSPVMRIIYSDGSTVVTDENNTTFETDRSGTYKSWHGPFELQHISVSKRASLRGSHTLQK